VHLATEASEPRARIQNGGVVYMSDMSGMLRIAPRPG
jgi:hypothetical protein